jgi:hypothetical protein
MKLRFMANITPPAALSKFWTFCRGSRKKGLREGSAGVTACFHGHSVPTHTLMHNYHRGPSPGSSAVPVQR